MPPVPLRALLIYDQSLLLVCAPGRSLGNNIIGLTNIACGHNQAPFAQGDNAHQTPGKASEKAA
jgi:hypothetical protein